MSKSDLYNGAAIGWVGAGVSSVAFFIANDIPVAAIISGLACLTMYGVSRQIAVNSFDDHDHHVEP